MKTNWTLVNEKIKNNVADILKNGNPSFSNIDEAIILFKKIILHQTNIKDLDGLPKVLIPALHEAYITNKGEIGSLRHIATSLDAFLKKTLIIVKEKEFHQVNRMNLISLFKELELNQDLINQKGKDYPQLEEENLESFKGKNEYLEYLGYARIIRNKVHDSPNWNEIEVFTYLRNILVVYLYTAIKHRESIQSIKTSPNISKSERNFDTGENKMLFDFISFGNTTTEIKTQVINAYILHYLSEKGKSSISPIINSSNNYFGNKLNKGFFERRINSLMTKKQIEYTKNKELKLTSNEILRIEKMTKDFSENKDLFFLYFDEILIKYDIRLESEKLITELKNFFELNFDIDIKEAYDKGIEITKDGNSIYNELVIYLKSITKDDISANELFRDLLELCNDSDFLIRISASKVFSRLTNPDQFQNYLRLQKRVVYLDTQLILHALCLNYSNAKYDNIYYKITDELIEFVKSNDNIELKISKLYLSEVVYQLKLALLLIPFENYNRTDISNNIFYLFYNYLKESDLLEEHHDSFASFLKNWLLVTEDDVYDTEFESIAKNSIQDLLKKELRIDVVHLPKYDNKNAAISVLENVFRKKMAKPKSHHVMVNDALMVCHLADKDFHEIEPFFLTWDKSFTEFRKDYKKKFTRLEPISWHLFNPSKFLNHMSLLDFKINPKSITNEYLSIIDSIGIHEKTQTIFDSINKLLDLKNISKGQRRKYIKIASEIFNENEFNYNINLPEDSKVVSLTDSFSDVLGIINNYYYNGNSKYSISKYRTVMLIEESFIKITKIIAKKIKETHQEANSSNDFLFEIDKVLKDN